MLKTSIIVFILIVLGKITGFLKDILLTYFHGVSYVTDAFFLSNSIVSVLYMAVFASIPVVVIPVCTKAIQVNGSIYSQQTFRLLVVYILISILFSFAVLTAAEYLVQIFSGELDTKTANLSVMYISIMSITFVFSAAVSFFNAMQLSERNILPSYATPILNNVIFMIGLALFSLDSEFYIVLILGIVAWLILVLANIRSVWGFFSTHFISKLSTSEVLSSFVAILPAILALYVDQVNATLAIFFAAEVGDGAVTVMNYGNKLNSVFLSVFLVILTTIIFPRISQQVAQRNIELLKLYLLMYFRLFLLAGIPSVALVSIFSEQLVSLIFERGAFRHEEVVSVSSVFSILVFGLIFSLLRDLTNRVFFAFQESSYVLYISMVALLINFLLSFIWYEDYGLSGLAYASLVSLIVNVIILLYFLDSLMQQSILMSTFKILLSLIFGGGLVWGCYSVGIIVDAPLFLTSFVSVIIYLTFVYLSQFGFAWPNFKVDAKIASLDQN